MTSSTMIIAANFREDLEGVFRKWPSWIILAWDDIRARYSRTKLGPFWVTAGLGTTILVMGVVYPKLFRVSIDDYLPYLTVGFLAWTFILSLVNDGCSMYVNAGPIIKEVRMPITFFAFHLVMKHLIIFWHNFIIYVIVIAIFPIKFSFSILLFFPALALYMLSGIAIATIFGILGARFRDIPPIVGSAMQVLFFLTPIFWSVESMDTRPALVTLNPLYHYIEILREPLLGRMASLLSWGVVLGSTVGLLTLMALAVGKLRHRVVFWL